MLHAGDDREVANSMFEAGKALQLKSGGGSWREALDTYDSLIARFQHSPDPMVGRRVADALTWGAYITRYHVSEERALARYEMVINMFGNRPEDVFRQNLAVAWGGKAIVLDKLGRIDERIHALEELARRIDYRPWDHSKDETVVSEELAKAALNHGGTLRDLDRDQEAVTLWVEAIRRFHDDHRPSVQEFVAWMATSAGAALRDLGRRDDALAQWDYVITRFANVDDADVQEQVERARNLTSAAKPWWRFW